MDPDPDHISEEQNNFRPFFFIQKGNQPPTNSLESAYDIRKCTVNYKKHHVCSIYGIVTLVPSGTFIDTTLYVWNKSHNRKSNYQEYYKSNMLTHIFLRSDRNNFYLLA